MNQIALEELTRIKIEEHFKNKNKKTMYYKTTKEDLINLCLKVVKEIMKYEEY